MKLKTPAFWKPSERKQEADDSQSDESSEDEASYEDPEPEPVRRRTRRPTHSHVRQLKKGFAFLIKSQLQNPDNENAALHCAVVVEYIASASLVSYHCHVEIDSENQPGIWKLDESQAYFCAVGEMLPPFNWRMTVFDDNENTFRISDRLSAKFAKTVADMR